MDELENEVAEIRAGLEQLERLAAAKQQLARLEQQAVITVGNALIRVKCKIPRGQWQTWLKTNFNLALQTARRFMQIARRFGGKTLDVERFNSSQLAELLALDEGDEQTFLTDCAAAGKSVELMTIKQLRAEISAWKSAASNADEKIAALKKENAAKDKRIAELEQKLQSSAPDYFEALKNSIEIFLRADDREQILNQLAAQDFSCFAAASNALSYACRELVNRKRAERARRADNSRQLLILEI